MTGFSWPPFFDLFLRLFPFRPHSRRNWYLAKEKKPIRTLCNLQVLSCTGNYVDVEASYYSRDCIILGLKYWTMKKAYFFRFGLRIQMLRALQTENRVCELLRARKSLYKSISSFHLYCIQLDSFRYILKNRKYFRKPSDFGEWSEATKLHFINEAKFKKIEKIWKIRKKLIFQKLWQL